MSAICNKALSLTEEGLRDKKQFAQSAGGELNAAAGELFRALELAEHGDALDGAAVYASAARERLVGAARLLADVAAILETGTFSEETAEWYRQLDYDRLYRSGTGLGEVPQAAELWHEFARIAAAEGPVGICHDLYARTLGVAELIARWLRETAEHAAGAELVRVQCAMADLATYARLVAFANKVEPRDPVWLLPKTAVKQ
ncbi:hypothetical protein ACFQVC_26775 [Streptomyces monticola]|uniref:Uncharacterized protein n=1 Tax=Streptomyces monticola TaxID=2666263 RepID=A0ABW2JQR2_9ACTN